MKLKNHPYANCSVSFSDGCVILKSYETDTVIIDSLGWVSVTGLYSATTRKHIGYFLKEYAPALSYQYAKRLYENKQAYNLYTGEVKKF